MYSGKKYLVKPIISCPPTEAGGNYNELSGGLPHSEIHGSKLILSSPWLIAEYHVLHRLLLPRHPPNALIALDLIRKKKDLQPSSPAPFCVAQEALPVRNMYIPAYPSCLAARQLDAGGCCAARIHMLVVLDLDNVVVGRRSGMTASTAPPLGNGRQRRFSL